VTVTTPTQETICNRNTKTFHDALVYKIWSLLL